MTSPMPSLPISIVIPVYCSAEILPALVTRLSTVLDSEGIPFELILVNDGSRDGSWQVIRALMQHQSTIHGINLMRNYGQHNALLAGIRAARYSIIVTM